MGRPNRGLKVEWRRGIGYARFTHAGQPYLVSTGKRDTGEAHAEAARIFARVTGGAAPRADELRSFARMSRNELWSEWLASLEGTLDPETIRTYERTYCGLHWPAHFSSIEAMCDEATRERYRSARLRVSYVGTVKKECWVADKFLRWCAAMGAIPKSAVPPALVWESKTLGTRKKPKRRVELTHEQVRAFLKALPDWWEGGRRKAVAGKWAIRDRFVFQYETGLRPATLDALVWSDWLGHTGLLIRDEADKVRYGREVPLSDEAFDALYRVRVGAIARGLPHSGDEPIFGRHDYGGSIRKAAKAAGIPSVAPYDLRHGRATHLVEAGASLAAVGHLLGHRRATTTNVYVHPSARAAREALDMVQKQYPVRVPTETGNDRQEPKQLPPPTDDGRGVPVLNNESQVANTIQDTPTHCRSETAGNRSEPPGPALVPETISPLWAPHALAFVDGLLAIGVRS